MLNFYGNILIFTILFSSIHQILTTAQQDDPKWPQNNPGGPIVFKNASDRHFKGNGQKQRENDREREGNEVAREKQKWPQNYPGHVPETGTNSRGPFFPGHIGHWPGKNDWDKEENGQNGMGHRGGGHGKRRNEEEKKHRSNWLDRIMPWRRHRHEDREMRPHHRNHHNKMTWQHDDAYETSRDRNNDESNEDEEKEAESNEADERGNNSMSRDEIDGSEKLENETKTVVIRIGGGPVKGLVSYLAGKDRPAFVFRGIPFAEPPVGKLRFAPLKKKKPWRNQLLDATKYKAACLSNTTRTRSPQHYISEDCIYMNVFADPKCRKEKSCPVLFYVHGGGFAYDSATMFNDSQIVHKYASDGVVFLIPAYRLGVFGFLDLGEDRPVKRNLGMHDIIFALDWAHKEVHNFGGDPKRITIMGNSAGATAVSYLCASPAVKKDAFQQAIISSGVPTLTANANLIQTYALLEHFNCIVNNQTNETLSMKQRVECLRRVDSLELLREQQRNEVRGIVFSGPETDDELLPESSYASLMKHWKPITLIYSTTSHEFGKRWGNNYLDNECHKGLVPFGYFSQSAYNACMARYNRTFDQENHMRVSYESMHAESFLTSLVNTRLGGISYVGEFELANYSNHADDLYFFFGLHYIPLNSSDVKLMDIYYPKMIKNFLYGHAPDKDWKPQNWNGRNYFRITFNVSDNGTLLEYPHNVDGYQDIKGLNFWLHDLAIVERNARQEAMEAKANQSNSEDKAWEEVFGEYNQAKERAQRDNEFLLPPSSFLALPGPLAEDGNDSMPIIDGNNETSGMDISPWILPNQSADLLTQNYDDAKNGNELSRVWSAFWLTMTVTLLLAVSLFMLAITKAIYRYKNVRGYHPTGGGHTENGGGMFTEKTRIIHANGNNTMRYS